MITRICNGIVHLSTSSKGFDRLGKEMYDFYFHELRLQIRKLTKPKFDKIISTHKILLKRKTKIGIKAEMELMDILLQIPDLLEERKNWQKNNIKFVPETEKLQEKYIEYLKWLQALPSDRTNRYKERKLLIEGLITKKGY